jgi:hypothetical protein
VNPTHYMGSNIELESIRLEERSWTRLKALKSARRALTNEPVSTNPPAKEQSAVKLPVWSYRPMKVKLREGKERNISLVEGLHRAESRPLTYPEARSGFVT